jgi:inner membrane transporter RhtA
MTEPAEPAAPALPAAPAALPNSPAVPTTPIAGGSSAGRLNVLPPEMLIIAAAVSVQCGAGLATSLLREFGPLPIVTMRIVFGTILLLIFRPARIRGATRSALLSCVALGVILAVMNSTFYLALTRIPLGVAVTIEFCGPLTLAVLGSRRWLDLVWVVLAAAGIYALAGGRLVADDAIGIVAVFIAGFCWALYILVGRRMSQYWPDGRGLSVAMVVASLLVMPVTLAFSDARPVLAAPLAIAGGVVVAVFSSAIPYTLEIAALRRLPAATFGVLMSLEPAIAALVGFILLGQVLHSTDLLAIATVAVASAGASLSARRLATTPGELEAT